MLRWRGLWTAVLYIGVFSPHALLSGGAAKIPKQDRAWKQYRNAHWGYCVSYPARWLKGDAYDGAGLFVRTGITKFSANPLGAIDVSVQERPSSTQRTGLLNLADNVQVHQEGVVKFQRAQQMQVMETRPMTLAASPALFTKDRYFDPLERISWVEEVIFASRGNEVYRLELVCRADEAERFERVFQRMVESFSFVCTSTH